MKQASAPASRDRLAAQAAKRQLVGCRGKVEFETFSKAHDVARRSNRNGGGKKTYEAYRCMFGPHFHVGNAKNASAAHRMAFQKKRRAAREQGDESA